MATANGRSEPPLVVIVGPTASGKTALAIELARQFGGEIICADSRTIYKGMDIGTAKPTTEEQQLVPHWGLNLIEPNERFTAADFQRYAVDKIADIRRRGKVPFLVGGTGLYIDAVILDYQFGPDADQFMRRRLTEMTLTELLEYCNKNNIEVPENSSNKRYIIRTIEQNMINNRRRDTPINNSIIVGIATERELLRAKIERRIEQLFASGVVEEAKILGNKYGWDSEAMTANIYRLIHNYEIGEISYTELQRQACIKDWQLAKRQLTWLKRNKSITWLSLDEANSFVKEHLESWYGS